jgi:hypothetical protein
VANQVQSLLKNKAPITRKTKGKYVKTIKALCQKIYVTIDINNDGMINVEEFLNGLR